MEISAIAALTAHISFLLWELILGRPGVGRSSPPHQTAIIDSYSESSYLADKVLADLPLTHQTVISQIPALTALISFLLWELIFGRPGVGRSTPLHQMVIIDSYPESSYLADQVLADQPPTSNDNYRFLLCKLILGRPSVGRSPPTHQTAISQIPALTAHISFLLWELIFGRPGVGRSTPLHQMVIIDSYPESSYLADQVLADQPPTSNDNYRFLLCELILGRPSVGRSTLNQIAVSQIPALTAHISFTLWELIFGRPSVGRSIPLKQWFHRFLLWQLIFHSYSEKSYLADQCGQIYPPPNGNFRDP